MEIKTRDATEADKHSAKLLFDNLRALWPVMFKNRTALVALDAFARNGQLTVGSYVTWVDWVHAWELDDSHAPDLSDLGCDDIRIGCSYHSLSQALKAPTKYDMIVIDTPQGVHKDWQGQDRIEHWSFLENSLPLLGNGGVVVLYVNLRPYDKRVHGEHGYDVYAEYDFDRWMTERSLYYGQSEITLEMALDKYRQVGHRKGYRMGPVLAVPCLSDVPVYPPYATRLALRFDRQE